MSLYCHDSEKFHFVKNYFYEMLILVVFYWGWILYDFFPPDNINYLSDLVAGACLGLLTAWFVLP